MKVQEYQRTEKQIANQTRHLQFVPDRSGEILGEAISRVGNDMFSLYEKKAAEANELVADEAFSQYRQGHIDRAYGENGYRSKKGAEALGLTQVAMDALQKDYDKITENMNANQAKIFRRKAMAFNDSVRQSMEQYCFEQGEAHKEASLLGTSQSFLEQAVKVADDPNPQIRADAYILAKSSAENYYKHRGLSGVALTNQIRLWDSKFCSGLVTKAIAENPENPTKAQALLKRYENSLTEDDKISLKNKIRPIADAFEVSSVSNSIFAPMKSDNDAKNRDTFIAPIEEAEEQIDKALSGSDLSDAKKFAVRESVMRKVRAHNAIYTEKVSGLITQIEERTQKEGKTIEQCPEFYRLPVESRRKIQFGMATTSDPNVWVRFTDNNHTQAEVEAERPRLSPTDYQRFRANSVDAGKNRYEEKKLDSGLFEDAVRIVNPDLAQAKSDSKKTEKAWLRMASQALADEWMKKNPGTKMDRKTVLGFVQQASAQYLKVNDWWFDGRPRLAEIYQKDQEAMSGQGKPYERKGMGIPGGTNPQKFYDKVEQDYLTALNRYRAKEGKPAVTGTPYVSEVLRYFVFIEKRNPSRYQSFYEPTKQNNTGDL